MCYTARYQYVPRGAYKATWLGTMIQIQSRCLKRRGQSTLERADLRVYDSAFFYVVVGLLTKFLVDGQLVDTSFLIKADASLAIITASDDKGLEVIRHSTAHLLAQATQMLYPDAQVTIGPVIENGFYYDFDVSGGIKEEDLEKIEKLMKQEIKKGDRNSGKKFNNCVFC